ncbi:uncharacterized protein [Montipora foliosa]|uniref:uncharacterized protein n=1 Tax=Montipora foliosa TaxID=591990 RepID=UPI0035F16419
MEMEKLLQIGEKFGLQEEKFLEFVRKEEEKEEKHRQLEQERSREEEEKEEKRRQLEQERKEKLRQFEEEKEVRRQMLDDDERKEEEEKEKRRRREDEERETRRQKRELRKLEMEAELLKQKEAIEAAKENTNGKDDLDAYLQRFAATAKWEKTGWASKLSALLSGRALEVYSQLSEEAAQHYDRVKLALMKRYDLTEDGYRRKFRASKPEVDESPEQFIVRLERYLLRWLELSHIERSFEGLKDLIVEEHFIDSCPKELAIHLRERAPETLDQIAKIADQYLEAHGKHLFSSATKKPLVQFKAEETKNAQSDTTALQCYKCNARRHKAINCQALVRKCFLCGKQGHEARNCRSGARKSGGQEKDASVSLWQESYSLTGVRSKMPVVKGRVGEKTVNVLRDTGCSGVVVKKDLVSEDQFT